jgi:cell division protease FtsH
MNKTARINVVYALTAILGVVLFHDLWAGHGSVATLPYSEFKTLVREGKVKEIVITSNEIRGELKEPDATGKKYFHTTRVDTPRRSRRVM